jgi:hypothetical protein
MGFTFGSDDAGRSRVILEDEPDYIASLRIAPSLLEDHLKQGKWLVVSMSVWSIHDIRAGHRAIDLVKHHRGLVNLGLRPFDFPQENSTWVPCLGAEQIADQVQILVADQNHHAVTIQRTADASPVWVAISEGKVLNVRHGPRQSRRPLSSRERYQPEDIALILWEREINQWRCYVVVVHLLLA